MRNAENVVIAWKQLYGWSPLNTNIWLPSLSELIGYTGTEHINTGGYNAAMQGLNLSNWFDTDSKGGAQWNYFMQYNATGGGQSIWNACAQEQAWLRSSYYGYATTAWCTINVTTIGAPKVTSTAAVHPAVLYSIS